MSNLDPEIEVLGPDGWPIGFVDRQRPRAQRAWLNLVLLAATLVSTTVYGAIQFGRVASALQDQLWLGFFAPPRIVFEILTTPALLLEGLEFSLPLMAILLVHESGHYLACRRHGIDATLPYFLPVPFGIGTLGAFIRIRSPLRSRNELMDVGAAGPLAGFIATLPVLLVGIALSTPVHDLPAGGYIVFGEPVLFHALARLIHPDLLQGGDLFVHPTGMAAWFGLLVTALNLLPFGQLDGGHIGYALFGRWHRRAVWPLLVVLTAMGLLWPGWWLWAIIALVMGVKHPRMADEDRPLDRLRTAIGWAALAIFVLSFTPMPVGIVP